MSRRFSNLPGALLLLGVLALVISSAGLTAQAQGGLSEEEQALLERAIAGYDKWDDYSSFVLDMVEIESLVIEMSALGMDISMENFVTREVAASVITGDPENVSAVVTLEVEESSNIPTQETSSAYTLEAEVRFVDDELYVSAEYLESEGDVVPLPSGWVLVESVGEILAFAELDLDEFLEEDEDSLFDGTVLLEQSITEITLETDTLEDGTPVDVITATVGGEGLLGLLDQVGTFADTEDNPFIEVMLDALAQGESASMTFALALDEDDNPRALSIEMFITIEGLEVDLGAISEESPPGITLDVAFTVVMSEYSELSNINAEMTPVEAPEIE